MTYDFETVVPRRGIGSMKWDEMEKYPGVGENVIPFSVADMELKNAPEIISGLKEYLDRYPLGYAQPGRAYIEAVQGWMRRRHGWEVEPEWIKGAPGVISAFFTAVKAFTKTGDGVMLMTPVYYPMYFAIERNGRRLVENRLVARADRYEIDFDDFEKKAGDPNTKLLILCSPHNPTGRVWTLEELERIGRICHENQVLVVSDEIHHDLVMPGFRHRVFASLDKGFAQNSIICTAPSKTFNLAGLQTSNIIIPNPVLRELYWKEVCTTEGNPKCNLLGLEACRIAYTRCDEWLTQLIALVDENRKTVTGFLEEHFPEIKVFRLEGTYLLWMDFNGLGIGSRELSGILKERAHLFFDDGMIFGEPGDGFERWNLACPTSYVLQALARLRQVISGEPGKRR